MLEHDKGLYDADLAHHRSRQRGERPRRPKLRLDAGLRAEVQAKLDEWSPEQIAAHLRALWPDRPERHLCSSRDALDRRGEYHRLPWRRWRLPGGVSGVHVRFDRDAGPLGEAAQPAGDGLRRSPSRAIIS